MRTPLLIMASPSVGGISTSAARYTGIASGHSAVTWTSSVSQSRTPFPITGTLKNLYVRATNAPGAGQSFTFAVIKNGDTATPTALSVTLSDAETSDQNTVDTVSITGGTDDICIRCLPSGTPADPGLVQIAMEFESTGADSTKSVFFLWHSASTASGYLQPGAGSGVSGTEAPMQVPAPVAGTIVAISAQRSAALGATQSAAYAIRVGGVDQLTATVTDSVNPASATGSAAFSAGDLLSVGLTATNTPTNGTGCVAVAYTPDTADYAMQFGVWSSSPSQAADAFGNACGRQGNGSLTEVEYYDIAPFDFTARRLFLVAASAPGGSATRTVILRDDAADTALTCQLTTATTNNEVSASAAVAAGSLINFKTTPANTPATTTKLAYGWVADTSGASPPAGGGHVNMLLMGVG